MTPEAKKATQRVFDEALKHIRKQGRPSVNQNGCAYRSSIGLGCAFAPAIRTYHKVMESQSARALLRHYALALHKWARRADPDICGQIQNAHDDSCNSRDFMADFEAEMALIAKRYGLKYTK